MTLRKYNKPYSLSHDFDRFFNDFFLTPKIIGDSGNDLMSNIPAVNIEEENEQFAIQLAAPGMKKDDFKIEIDDGVMTISSETKEEHESANDKFTRREFNYSSFSRSFTLPENIDEDGVKAQYKDGILTIAVPKTKEVAQKSRLIDIS
ncbi:MAG: Hsp20/alpha crystallin family protein [Crocinitomicaceae bacterium]